MGREKLVAALSRSGSAEPAYEFLRAKGLTHNATIGVLANIKQESGFNPRARGDAGGAHGLFQYHAPRRADILRGSGIDISKASYEEQLRGMHWEATQGKDVYARKAWKLLQNPDISQREAAAVWSKYFERPGATPAKRLEEQKHRGNLAEELGRSMPDKAADSGLTPDVDDGNDPNTKKLERPGYIRDDIFGEEKLGEGETLSDAADEGTFNALPQQETPAPLSSGLRADPASADNDAGDGYARAMRNQEIDNQFDMIKRNTPKLTPYQPAPPTAYSPMRFAFLDVDDPLHR
jgi:hypothetical protein